MPISPNGAPHAPLTRAQRLKALKVINNIAPLSPEVEVYPEFIKIAGGLGAGMMLSYCFQWERQTQDSNGWFHKTRQQWTEQTGLTHSEQKTARAKLVKIGVLEERRGGDRNRLYFRLNSTRLRELLEQLLLDPPNS